MASSLIKTVGKWMKHPLHIVTPLTIILVTVSAFIVRHYSSSNANWLFFSSFHSASVPLSTNLAAAPSVAASTTATTTTTFSRGNETWAQVPCVPPHCAFRCASQAATSGDIDCNPPRFAPASLTCTVHGIEQTFHNIVFGIPEQNVVACVPEKVHDFARVVPGRPKTYIFTAQDEAEYTRNYRASYFAYTWRKAGWDCLRHYEILASGTLPFFSDLRSAPSTIMSLLPKELILQAMELPGVPSSVGHGIDHAVFPQDHYHEIACKVLAYTRRHLTTKAVARYILETMGKPAAKKVLILSNKHEADYMREHLVHGMRELLGEGAIEYPVFDFLYEYPADLPPKQFNPENSCGLGYSYTHRLSRNHPVIDRSNLEERIAKHEFDVIIYGCSQIVGAEKGLPFLDLVLEHYDPSSLALINGDDWREWYSFQQPQDPNRILLGKAFYFFRELPPTCPVGMM